MMKKLVDDVHAELVELLDEAERHQENPRLIRLISAMVRLSDTNPPEENDVREDDVAVRTFPIPQDVCRHEHIGSNGMCNDCGKQVYQRSVPSQVAGPQGGIFPQRG